MKINGISNINQYGKARHNFKAQSAPLPAEINEKAPVVSVETYKAYCSGNIGCPRETDLDKAQNYINANIHKPLNTDKIIQNLSAEDGAKVKAKIGEINKAVEQGCQVKDGRGHIISNKMN